MKKELHFVFIALCLLFIVINVNAQFDGGSGTEADPWQIATIEQLNSVRDYLSGHFILTADLDFAGSAYDSANSTTGWDPISESYSSCFTGSFNGRGHSISNLYINRADEDYIGLFSFTQGADIDSIAFLDCNITGDDYVGALGGWNYSSSSISNCYVTGIVSGNDYVGGLVGRSYSCVLSGCHSMAKVSAERQVGGLIGDNAGSTTSNCYATESVSGNSYVGGLIGYNRNSSTVSNCCFTGIVTGGYYTGGLVGYQNSSNVSNCYATGSVLGSYATGGLVGNNENSGSISNSYAAGSVSGGTSSTGSLVGYNYSATITNGYFNNEPTGQSSGLGYDNNGQSVTGLSTSEMKQEDSFSGFDFSSIWSITNGETYPLLNSVYNPPVIIQDLAGIAKVGNTYTDTIRVVNMDGELDSLSIEDYPSGMLLQDSVITWTPDSTGNYSFTIIATDNNGYASKYMHQVYVVSYDGEGTEDNPYQVSTIEQLDGVRNLPDKYFILKNDLDFAGSAYDSVNSTTGWEPIGDYSDIFTGSFNGAGHSIRNLYINQVSKSNLGLFGSVNGAKIDSLAVLNCNITCTGYSGALVGYNKSSTITNCYATGNISGSGSYVGGLVGDNYTSTVTNCYATVDVSGTYYTGGLVGDNYTSTVTNCYATGNVSGKYYAGSLVGYNRSSSTITNCYATGAVSGSSYVGGLTGYNRISCAISNCYSTGNVSGSSNVGGLVGQNYEGTVTNSYFSIWSSGQSSGIGTDNKSQTVTGLNMSQMKEESSFTGFDFATIWAIRTDSTWPALLNLDNAPFAFPDTVTVGASMYISLFLENDYDYETLQDSLVISVDSLSAGSVENNAIFLPSDIGTNGSISAYYRVGGLFGNDTLWGNQTHSVVIVGANTAPVLLGSSEQTDEDVVLNIQLSPLASDNEDDALKFAIIDSTSNGELALSENSLNYFPKADFYGKDSLELQVSDGIFSDTAWIAIQVNALNDAPVLSAVAELNIDEDDTLAISMDNVTANDVDGDVVSLVIYSGSNYELGSDNQSVLPETDYNGLLEVPVAVTDGIDTSASMNMSITVNAVNDIPVLSAVTGLSMDEDGSLTISMDNVTASDVDGDVVSLVIYSGSNYELGSDNQSVLPETDYNGLLEVPVAVTDGIDTSTTMNMSITVNAVNDAPVLSAVTGLSMDEDGSLTISIDNVTASDVDGDVVNLIIYPGSNYELGSDKQSVLPETDYNGLLEVPVAVTDGIDTSTTMNMSITVNAVNDAPEINSTAPLTAIVGETYVYTVLASDIDNDELSYSLEGAPGDMQITDSIITWTPSEGTSTSGEIILTVSDGGLTATETFTITVNNASGIESPGIESVSIYPSPVNDFLTIECNSIIEMVQIVSLNGTVVQTEQVNGTNEKQIDLQHLQTGVYIVKVKTGTTVLIHEICKE